MRRRRDSRIRYGLVAIVALALAWTAVALISSPPASAEVVPGPLLLAGSDCDENGPFVQYRVTNETSGDETLTISIDEKAVIGSARLTSDETKRGRIEWRGSAAESVVLEAKWATNEEAAASSITVAPNPCVTVSASDFTGPSFMAGTDCQDDMPIVRWWMSNSAEEHRNTYVSISNEEGTTGETIWPADGAAELMFAGAQTSGINTIPAEYVQGEIVRVSGWAEGSGGIAETWTQMVIPICAPGSLVIAGGGTSTSIGGANGSVTTQDPLDQILASPPPVATTAGAVDGSSTTSTTQPGETTTTIPGETTTTVPGQTTTTVPGSSSTTTTTTTRPPGTTTTAPPGSTTTTTTTTTTTQPPTTTTTTTTTTIAPPADAVAPVFLAGADCGGNGAFIRYRVTNNNDTAQTLKVTFNGSTRVDSVSVSSGQTKWGTFTGTGGSNDPKPVIASWVGISGSQAPTLLMR
ncbi:MAG: hypothetical protein HKN91_04475, partial [Acidimicrobiia bacterium]|nr:hypothetical protein [Acidimicrobiia bacterium]